MQTTARLPAEWIVPAGKIERPRQGRPMPAYPSAGVGHHTQRRRIWAWRKGVIGELAIARQNFGPRIEERTRRDRDPGPRTIDGGIGLGRVDVWLFPSLGLGRRHRDGRPRD